jgi:hypothetical protein
MYLSAKDSQVKLEAIQLFREINETYKNFK